MKSPIEVEFAPTPKQALAWSYLTDDETTELLYGGGAGSGKSFLGCAWVTLMCIQHPGARMLIGRAVLKKLKESTLKTLFDLLQKWGLKQGEHFSYNITDGLIKFYNGSEILLKDLKDNPSDTNWDSLGSLEITGAFIDEAAEVSEKCKNVLSSRIRYKLKEFNIRGKLFMSCNPSKNWLYTTFYKPAKENTLPRFRRFIQALLRDNPHLDADYERRLSTLDPASVARLRDGDWEFNTDDTALVEYHNILAMFDCAEEAEITSDTYYLSADIARFGADKTVLIVWCGLMVVDIVTIAKSTVKEVTERINSLSKRHNIGRRNIVIDSDGIGGGVADYLPNSVNFINNARAMKGEQYKNLKSQCAFKLAELIKQGKILIKCDDIEVKEAIIQELEQLKRDRREIDSTKLAIISKDEMKKAINRSPDYLDALIMCKNR